MDMETRAAVLCWGPSWKCFTMEQPIKLKRHIGHGIHYFCGGVSSDKVRPNNLSSSTAVNICFVIVRARNLRAAANFIPTNSFRARKAYFSNEGRFEMVVALSNPTNGLLNANEWTGKEVESILTGQVSKDNTNKVLALVKEDL
ncbi:hypothetical protein Vadar_028334 [Vaccinium darrowii]|uniref:Uncharacterized protein n=1 Tax=Vaccinium darrowii TaxID=229202 RepID=A0ACB7Y3X2_9ERIC|nr:hypothetical protein Vadar_028334 [Vaccinium darrowii]